MDIHSAHAIHLYPDEASKVITITGDTYTDAVNFYNKLIAHNTLARELRVKARKTYFEFIHSHTKPTDILHSGV